MRTPMIGIVPLWDEERESIWMLPGYMNGVQQAGGLPFVLPLTAEKEVLRKAAALCDGFLLTGGHDISPLLYGKEQSEHCGTLCPQRDEMERQLFTLALEADKPIFGICRGIQLINALLGGTLYQDLPQEHPSPLTHKQMPPYDIPAHQVNILTYTPLHALLRCDTLAVNSYHHQAIEMLSDKLLPMAQAEDGVVEAVCLPDYRFVWAVQWHPEYALEEESSRKLFRAFVEACDRSI